MAKEADAHAAEDKEAREQIEARNGLDSLVYNIEKMLKDSGEKVQATDKTDVETALAEAKKTLEGSPSTADLKAAQEKLTQASHKLAEALYKGNAAETAASGGAAPGGAADAGSADAGQKKDEGVIDAEYVDVDEKK
jgi:molecular chaperone DnaK